MLCLNCRSFDGGNCPIITSLLETMEYDVTPYLEADKDYAIRWHGCVSFKPKTCRAKASDKS